jgi:hypothetical protein
MQFWGLKLPISACLKTFAIAVCALRCLCGGSADDVQRDAAI